MVAHAENLRELLQHAEAAEEKATESAAALTKLLAVEKSRNAELEQRLRRTMSEQQDSTLAKLESRNQPGKREEMLSDRDTAPRTAQAKMVEPEVFAAESEDARTSESSASLRARRVTAPPAVSEGSLRAVPSSLEALLRENEILRSKISLLPGARGESDDAALRKSIECLGREIHRLYAGQKDVDQDGGGPRERMRAES